MNLTDLNGDHATTGGVGGLIGAILTFLAGPFLLRKDMAAMREHFDTRFDAVGQQVSGVKELALDAKQTATRAHERIDTLTGT